ncbi:hypothetical protein V5F40_21745 [Xanthobacter sp. DSM 14520]|uniref:hypothetical protein n=1 Tax=Xanthobacter autotrophicus (strain ATCC BAA-1158 / Py2) TaxID=78245 RepID=UPI00372933A1
MSDTGPRFKFATKSVPPPPEPTPEQAARLDEAARQAGFHSRQPANDIEKPVERPAEGRAGQAGALAPRRRVARRDPDMPSHQIYVKGPVVAVNRFIAYCDENRMTYIDAIEDLLDRAEGKPK